MPQFRSHLFADDTAPKALSEDAKALAAVPPEAFEAVCRRIAAEPEVIQLVSGGLAIPEEKVEDCIKSTGVPAAEFAKALSVSAFLAACADRKQDTVEDLLHDLFLEISDTELANATANVATYTRLAKDAVTWRAQIRSSVALAFPTLKQVFTRISCVVAFSREYNPVRDSADTYVPGEHRLGQVAVLTLGVDRFGKDESTTVALDRNELDVLIRRLSLARKQLDSVAEDTGNGPGN